MGRDYRNDDYPKFRNWNDYGRPESEDHKRFRKVMNNIRNILEFAGFELEERIVLRDKTTGKIWR